MAKRNPTRSSSERGEAEERATDIETCEPEQATKKIKETFVVGLLNGSHRFW
jgi:hypothetical protein